MCVDVEIIFTLFGYFMIYRLEKSNKKPRKKQKWQWMQRDSDPQPLSS